jgi:NAD-dependent deacetylase
MFGEQPHNIPKAFQLAEKCDLCIVVGSSLVVMPINMVPQIALNHGGKLLIINHGGAAATHLDSQATLVIHEKAGVALPKILEKVREISGK